MAKQSHGKRVTFRWSNAIPKTEGSDDCSDLAVLPRRHVDLVVIPNLDKGAPDGVLGRMIKVIMASMVKCLRQDDRLCWKGVGGEYKGLIEKASCNNLEKMIDISLTVKQITLGIELEAACEVLEKRSPEESKCRLGLVALLSIGQWVELREKTLPTAYQSKRSGRKFPVYGILLTNYVATTAMPHIAGNGSGGAHVCYVQDMEIPEMEKRVGAFLEKAMSPAVRIDMVTSGGVAISSAMTMSESDGGDDDDGEDGADEDDGDDYDDVHERLLQGRRRRGHQRRRQRRRSD